MKKIHGIHWKKLSLLEVYMKVLLPKKMIKVLLYNYLTDWKDLLLTVILQKKMVKPLVLMKLPSSW